MRPRLAWLVILWAALAWADMAYRDKLGASLSPTAVMPDTATMVPCGSDQDCAEKNPHATGLYAFPEKANHVP